jgi:hypothetical protein
MRTHFIPLRIQKRDFFGEVDEAMFQGVERTSEIIFCILGIEKDNLGEIAGVLFEVGKLP